MARIAASIITGDVERVDLLRLFHSLKGHVDGIFIAHNGQRPLPFTDEDVAWIKTRFIFRTQDFEWEDNFAAMRQNALDMIWSPASKEVVGVPGFDWALWIDADDTLETDGLSLYDVIDGLDPNTQQLFLRYDYAHDQSGNVIIQHWRERLLRLDNDWRWKGRVHETVHGRPGTQGARRDTIWIKHHRDPEDDALNAINRKRNRRILMAEKRERPDDPRVTFYLAREVQAEAGSLPQGYERDQTFRAAIRLFEDFLRIPDQAEDDVYHANGAQAECLREIGDFNRAIDVDLQGIKIFPTWPQSYIGLSRSCMLAGDHAKMLFWAEACLNLARQPQTAAIFEPMSLDYTPNLLAGIACEQMNWLPDALRYYRKCLERAPENEFLAEKVSVLDNLLSSLPKYDTETATPLWKQQRKLLAGGRKNRSIAFLTRPLFEPWHPKLEAEGGAGGAETCIMRLAPRLAKDGYRVVVFGTPGPHAGVDPDTNVEWYPVDDWHPHENFGVTVASRAPEFFDAQLRSKKKLLWMHDVNVGPNLGMSEWGDRLSQIDRIIALTPWHSRHLHRLYGVPFGQLQIVPNGIESQLYEGYATRDPNKFIWSSSPDRGLDVLVQHWPVIRQMIPEAVLHVFYGWHAIDRIIESGGPGSYYLQTFKAGVMDAIDQLDPDGFVWHDRVPQHELAAEQMASSYWLYPTHFQETFCITAIEMQAAGVIPITSNVGALRDTVLDKTMLIDGWPNNVTHAKQWMKLVEAVYKMPDEAKDHMRQRGRVMAEGFSWENVSERWKKMLAEI
jgi:glycosyltransferase involved in cell wall biosynthesis